MYGKTLVFDAFFNGPDLTDDRVGGWLIRGHDSEDVYQEYVVAQHPCPVPAYPDRWIDWIRAPIEKGSPLLSDEQFPCTENVK